MQVTSRTKNYPFTNTTSYRDQNNKSFMLISYKITNQFTTRDSRLHTTAKRKDTQLVNTQRDNNQLCHELIKKKLPDHARIYQENPLIANTIKVNSFKHSSSLNYVAETNTLDNLYTSKQCTDTAIVRIMDLKMILPQRSSSIRPLNQMLSRERRIIPMQENFLLNTKRMTLGVLQLRRAHPNDERSFRYILKDAEHG